MAITDAKIVQQTRSPSTANDVSSLAIPMRPVGGGEDQQGAHLSQVGRRDRPLHPRHRQVNLKPRSKRERRERREKRKDDREKRRNPNTTHGNSALSLRLPQGAAGLTHVARQGGRPSQEGKPVTR